MSRKFVSITPFVEEGRSGIWLYAICEDGKAWRARHLLNGELMGGGWAEVPALPDGSGSLETWEKLAE